MFGLEPSAQSPSACCWAVEVWATDSDVPGGSAVDVRDGVAVAVTVVADSMVCVEVVHDVTVGWALPESADWPPPFGDCRLTA
jgi:hypothetical protein